MYGWNGTGSNPNGGNILLQLFLQLCNISSFQQSEISDSDAEAYKNEIIEPLELLEIVQYTVIGVGAFVMLVGLVVFAYFKCGPPRDKVSNT